MIFWTKFAQKRHSHSKSEKVNITIEFYILDLVYAPNFTLNKQFWNLEPNLPKKGISCQQMEKLNITIELCIFTLVLVPTFSLKWQFWFFEPNLLKKGIYGLKEKKSHFCVRPWPLLIFCTGADRHNGILMSLLLLVPDTKVLQY